MIYLVFSVHDSKADAFLPPFILPKEAMALRAFSDCVNSEDHQFGKNPEDYTLFELGSFNDETGQYLLHRSIISKGNGLEFRLKIPTTEVSGNGRAEPETDSSVEEINTQTPI
jgi:hypothetical protein